MVRPHDFGFNEETGLDNEFQKRPTDSEKQINEKANAEFQTMVDTLRACGITVLVLEKPDTPYPRTPDAIFPNNWFSTEHDGTLITYPMAAISRRYETRPLDVEKLLVANGYKIRNVIHVGALDTIESVGGGSARCMMAEIFSEKSGRQAVNGRENHDNKYPYASGAPAAH